MKPGWRGSIQVRLAFCGVTCCLHCLDLLVDRSDLEDAREKISRTVLSLRFAIDTVGRETAKWSQDVLLDKAVTTNQRLHRVGLTGLSKELSSAVKGHKLPIKLLHTNPELGNATSWWMEVLL